MSKVRNILLSIIVSATAFSAAADDISQDEKGELVKEIRTSQSTQDCNGMTGLFYTQGVDADRMKSFTKTIQDLFCVNFHHKINSIAFQKIDPDKVRAPSDFNGTHSAYTLQPLGVVVIDYGFGAPSETKSLSFLYGAKDNKAYLITTRKADTQ